MTKMTRQDFYNAIRDDFFENRTADFELFKSMVRGAAPIFGELKVEITEKEDGGKKIEFIDVDEAQFVLAPEGVDTDEVDTSMTTTALIIHLDKENVIQVVEHGFKIFTRANKSSVLLYAGLIGKKIDFE